MATDNRIRADKQPGRPIFRAGSIEGSKPQNSGNHSASTQKIDYMEILSEEEFARFRILRECRKLLAREMGIPAYAILVDSQLAELSKSDIHTLSAEKLKILNLPSGKLRGAELPRIR